MLIGNARVVTPDRVLAPGWVSVSGERIDAVGTGAEPGSRRASERNFVDLGGRCLLPGFVDQHVHGGGGASCTGGDPEEAMRMVAFHRERGTTSTLASLITAPLSELLSAISSLADLADDGHIAGIHLEGPFLAAKRCGAQNPAHLLEPDRHALSRMIAAGRGHVRMVTIAPEPPGALDLVRDVVDAGAVAAVGHTDATYDEAAAAFDAGATVATHLFNGMRPLQHRDPGVVGAALDRESAVCEVIPDGIHLHEATLRLVVRAVGAARVAGVTDAMVAAGAGDGSYRLGELSVTVKDGAALLDGGDGSLAGSTLDTGTALRRVLEFGLSIGEAVALLAGTPARVLGIDDTCGAIAPHLRADFVVCEADGTVAAVMCRGRWTARERVT